MAEDTQRFSTEPHMSSSWAAGPVPSVRSFSIGSYRRLICPGSISIVALESVPILSQYVLSRDSSRDRPSEPQIEIARKKPIAQRVDFRVCGLAEVAALGQSAAAIGALDSLYVGVPGMLTETERIGELLRRHGVVVLEGARETE